MLGELKKVAQHTFLSYPRAHRALTERILRHMRRARLQAWIDDVAIEPGTRDWERSVREGVMGARAVVLICSPQTVSSQYVQAELKLADKAGCPVVPVWVAGDDWVDCVPLGLVNAQYIDCRDSLVDQGMEALIIRLKKLSAEGLPRIFVIETMKECPPAFIPILVSKTDGHRLSVEDAGHVADWEHPFGEPLRPTLLVIAVNPEAYDSLEQLLDDLYTLYLRDRYKKYTYGRDWVLARASAYVSLFALPLEWLAGKRECLLVEKVPDYLSRATPLHTFGLTHGIWAIVDDGFDDAFGLCTSDEAVAGTMFEEHRKSLLFQLERWTKSADPHYIADKGRSGFCAWDRVVQADYKYRVLVAAHLFHGSIVPHDVFILEGDADQDMRAPGQRLPRRT